MTVDEAVFRESTRCICWVVSSFGSVILKLRMEILLNTCVIQHFVVGMQLICCTEITSWMHESIYTLLDSIEKKMFEEKVNVSKEM